MFKFERNPVSSNISRFRVIVESTENYDIAGTLYNDFYGFAIDFNGIRQMISYLDEFFDYVNFPQATHKKRSFHEQQPNREIKHPYHGLRDVSAEAMQDKHAAFLLHVQFRQNSTWQGTLEWIDEKKIKRFRSELEMIGMIADAIGK